jgi:ABC-type Na+ efflux pump permease subunit
MDTPTEEAAEVIGKAVGAITVAVIVIAAYSVILLASWNRCVPQVFGGNEITLQQSLAMLGVAWTLSSLTRWSKR